MRILSFVLVAASCVVAPLSYAAFRPVVPPSAEMAPPAVSHKTPALIAPGASEHEEDPIVVRTVVVTGQAPSKGKTQHRQKTWVCGEPQTMLQGPLGATARTCNWI